MIGAKQIRDISQEGGERVVKILNNSVECFFEKTFLYIFYNLKKTLYVEIFDVFGRLLKSKIERTLQNLRL